MAQRRQSGCDCARDEKETRASNDSFGEYQAFLASVNGPANNFGGPAFFDIELQAVDLANNLIAQNHISVDVIL